MLEQQSILALLQTFEVTARHLSFTLAAHEMNLTQGAVSHRIRRLEMHIGFRLFIRMTRKLALTEEGKRLLATLSHSLRAINDEIEDIRDQDLRGTLHIGIAPTLAHLWLMPRLPRFQTQWPGLNLQFRVRAGVMDFNEERVDLAIFLRRHALSRSLSTAADGGKFAPGLLPALSPAVSSAERRRPGGARLDPCVRIHRRTGSICGMAPVVPAQRTGVTF